MKGHRQAHKRQKREEYGWDDAHSHYRSSYRHHARSKRHAEESQVSHDNYEFNKHLDPEPYSTNNFNNQRVYLNSGKYQNNRCVDKSKSKGILKYFTPRH